MHRRRTIFHHPQGHRRLSVWSNTRQQSDSCLLLRLPPELRLLIYEEPIPGGLRLSQREHAGTWFKDMSRAQASEPSTNRVELLPTRQKIHDEARPVLYAKCTFYFHFRIGYPDEWAPGESGRPVTECDSPYADRLIDVSSVTNNIRLLEIRLDVQQSNLESLRKDCSRLDKVIRRLKMIPSASELHIYIRTTFHHQQTVFDQLLLRFGAASWQTRVDITQRMWLDKLRGSHLAFAGKNFDPTQEEACLSELAQKKPSRSEVTAISSMT